MLLRLTDGTTTLTLSGAGAYLGATYFPTSQAGAERLTESAVLTLEGTADAVRAAAQAVDLLLRSAPERKRLGAPPIYVEYRPLDSGEVRRAEVFDGFGSWSQAPAERYLDGSLNTVRYVATFERDAGWEGAEVELLLSSAVTAEATGGVTVTGSANTNWAALSAANVLGTRPAPIRLRITNATGAGRAWRRFHVGLNVFSAPSSADLWLLGSEAVNGAARSWSAGADHNGLTWLFPLSATLLGQAQGRTFRVLAAFDSLTSTANLRASVGSYISSLYVPMRIGSERTGVRKLIDLGEFPIPPGGYNVANADAALAITVRSAASGSGTLNFVMLMPTDGYRKLEQVGYIAESGESVVDDGIDGGTYILSGSNRYPILRGVGALRIYPGANQRLYILFDEDGGFTAGRQMTVRAWYRPVYDNV
jgi:hypothetical protein